MQKVLVIDDDPAVALIVRAALEDTPFEVASTQTAASGLSLVARERPVVVLLDVLLPDQVGLSALIEIRRRDPSLPVVVITGRGANEHAIDALRLGAHDFLFKPLEPGEVRKVLVAAASRSPGPTLSVRTHHAAETSLLVGRAPAMQQLFRQLGRTAGAKGPVLITGENGAGKELAARAIHLHSRANTGRFVSFPCAHENPAELAVMLFGTDGRLGAIGEAAGGTLFLDEVAALPLSLQGQLISRLEDSTDLSGVRLIAATTQVLEELAAAGQFRSDLYYTLAGCQLHVPPLRERLEDLPALVETLLARLCRAAGRKAPQVTPAALSQLAGRHWTGNIRELACVLQQTLLHATGPEITPEMLGGLTIHAPVTSGTGDDLPAANGSTTDWNSLVTRWMEQDTSQLYSQALGECERQLFSLVLRHTGGNQARAAKLLGITRSSLRLKLRSLGLVIDRQIDVRDGA